MEANFNGRMYSSWFSYNIARPYPFRWFTPIVVLGGIVLTVLFSLVNLGANGYYLRTVYTNDPNTTVREGEKWFMKAPFSWGDRLRPICEPQILSVGDQLFTTNLGFTWEVTSVTRSSNNSQGFTSMASIPYLNNTLQDCRLDKVSITLVKADLAPPPGWWISWTPSSCITTAHCTINSESGDTNITMQTSYLIGGDADTNHDYVIEDNYTTHASTWWGTRLLNAYWIGLESVMSQVSYEDDSSFPMRGLLEYSWNETDKKSIRDLDFFSLAYYILSSDATIDNGDNGKVNSSASLIDMYKDPSRSISLPALEGLHFAKIMYSLLTIDLGNSKIPSLLTNHDDLQYILSAPDDTNRQPDGYLYDAPSTPGWQLFAWIPTPEDLPDQQKVLINESYAQFNPQMGPLGAKNATFYSQYACSIPFQKSTGTMLLAILIADLVFLQAAWQLLTWVADRVLTRQDEKAMFCAGCTMKGYDAVSMHPLTPGTPVNLSQRSVSSRTESHQGLLYSMR